LLSRRSARREEWGNPAEEKFFDYMLSYSPINNVAAQAYPALLITAGLNDPRVAYWEPAKWTATLRDLKTDDNPLLLKVRSSFCTAPSRERSWGDTHGRRKEPCPHDHMILRVDRVGSHGRWKDRVGSHGRWSIACYGRLGVFW
jgi:hypothetical protein